MLSLVATHIDLKTGEVLSREVVGPAPEGRDPYKELAAKLACDFMDEFMAGGAGAEV